MIKRRKSVNPDSHYFDYNLLFVIIFLSCFGLVMIYSASYYTAQIDYKDGAFFVKKQAAILLLGFVIMFIVSKLDYHKYTRLWGLAWTVSLLMMFLVNFTPLGVERNGKKRWLGYKNRTIFQPAELVKIALIVTVAVMIVSMLKVLQRIQVIGLFLVVAGLPGGLVLMNNLSSGLIIFGIVFVMYFVASKDKKHFAGLAVLGIAFAVLVVILVEQMVKMGILQPYQASRILVWQDPEAYPLNGGYQVLQGLYAIGSGGFFGKGLGNSVQKLEFIPEAQNDMIFSIICEELGLFGAICVMLLFLFMIYRFMLIANNAPDLLGSMLVVGVMAQVSIQVFLNIAVATNFLPNTGVSLPFISYGGTSLIFLMTEMGMVLGVSRQIRFE